MCYESRWAGLFSVEGDGYLCLVRSNFASSLRLGMNEITVFWRDTQWRRSDTVLRMRCHEEHAIRSALWEAGFRHIQTELMDKEVGRAFWLSRK